MYKQSAASGAIDLPAMQCCTSARVANLLWPVLTTLTILVATAGQLHWQGRRWWCTCGQWLLWTSDAWGPHNSQHLLDPYSLTHVLHGLILCGIMTLAGSRLPLGWRLVLALSVECAWEIIENSTFVINRYRAATAALGYQGDTVANSMGDILSCAVGFWVASRFGWWKSLVLFLAVEVVLLCWIRDSLVLNVVMLICPVDAIRAWQTGG
jgi:hypothetical protein